MMKTTKPKIIVKCIIEWILIVFILLLFHIPVSYVENLGLGIFNHFGSATYIITSIWRFIIEVSYLILFMTAFLYIFKTRYLDKYGVSIEKNKEEIEETNISTNPKGKELTIRRKEPTYALVGMLGKIAFICVKVLAFFLGLPFVCSFLLIIATLVVDLFLLIKGIFYVGILIMILSASILNFLVLEIIFDFVFTRKVEVKRIFIMFIGSLIGIGLGLGITTLDIASTRYIDKVPTGFKQETVSHLYPMTDQLILSDSFYYGHIEFIEDESLPNQIKVDITYYSGFTRISSSVTENQYLSLEQLHPNKAKDIWQMVMADLSRKEVHNYDLLYRSSIKVIGSRSTLETLKQNRKAAIEKERTANNKRTEEDYNRRNEAYEQTISKLQEENRLYQERTEELTGQVEEYKNKIKNLNEQFKGLITD